jgi:hypothetical protein
MSEVLVPNKVDIKYLRKIYCNNYNTKSNIENILYFYTLNDIVVEDDTYIGVDVEVNKEIFF